MKDAARGQRIEWTSVLHVLGEEVDVGESFPTTDHRERDDEDQCHEQGERQALDHHGGEAVLDSREVLVQGHEHGVERHEAQVGDGEEAEPATEGQEGEEQGSEAETGDGRAHEREHVRATETTDAPRLEIGRGRCALGQRGTPIRRARGQLVEIVDGCGHVSRPSLRRIAISTRWRRR